jgi:hypothetical protein
MWPWSKCKVCAAVARAKDDEIRYLRLQVEQLNDRLMAQSGTLMDFHISQSHKPAGPDSAADLASSPDQPRISDEEWQHRELSQAAEDVVRTEGKIRPDFGHGPPEQ